MTGDGWRRIGGGFVTDDLRGRENDVIWRVRFEDRWLYVYLLLDEKRLSSLDPSLRNLAGALFDFERAKTTGDILTTVQRLLAWLDEPSCEPVKRAFAIWLRRVLSETRGEPVDVEDLLEVKSMLVERAREWVEQWKREGLEQGLEQGQLRGEANLLLRQLARKFGTLPDKLTARVLGAGFDELEIWGERVLDARTLKAVFED